MIFDPSVPCPTKVPVLMPRVILPRATPCQVTEEVVMVNDPKVVACSSPWKFALKTSLYVPLRSPLTVPESTSPRRWDCPSLVQNLRGGPKLTNFTLAVKDVFVAASAGR